ncbi:MAG: hypothetical protein ACLFUR_05745 [Candidatus Hadarchaeia archaeon]
METYVDLFRPFSGIDVIFSVLVIPIVIGMVVAYASKSFISKTESVIRKELIEPILGKGGKEKARKMFNWMSIVSYLFVAGFTSSAVGFMIEGKDGIILLNPFLSVVGGLALVLVGGILEIFYIQYYLVKR